MLLVQRATKRWCKINCSTSSTTKRVFCRRIKLPECQNVFHHRPCEHCMSRYRYSIVSKSCITTGASMLHSCHQQQPHPLFISRVFTKAIGFYSRALETLKSEPTADTASAAAAKKLKVAILTNRSACHLNEKSFQKCVDDCSAALDDSTRRRFSVLILCALSISISISISVPFSTTLQWRLCQAVAHPKDQTRSVQTALP